MAELQGDWLTFPAESLTSDKNIIVTVRTDVDRFRDNPRMKYRVTVGWPYGNTPDGMPSEADAELMDQATNLLADTFRRDPAAILTEISTGDGRREWVFYTASLGIFNKCLNRALEPLPVLPLEFSAEEDEGWESHPAVEE